MKSAPSVSTGELSSWNRLPLYPSSISATDSGCTPSLVCECRPNFALNRAVLILELVVLLAVRDGDEAAGGQEDGEGANVLDTTLIVLSVHVLWPAPLWLPPYDILIVTTEQQGCRPIITFSLSWAAVEEEGGLD